MNCLESKMDYVRLVHNGATLRIPYREEYFSEGIYQTYMDKLKSMDDGIVLPIDFEIEFNEGCNKMYKTELTIIKDSPSQMVMEPTKITMVTELTAKQWAASVESVKNLPNFKFGTSVIYTHGVQAFIFKDVE